MSIFLLSAVPLTYFLFVSVEFKESADSVMLRRSYLYGLLVFAASLPVIVFINRYINPGYMPVPLFLYHWATEFLFFTAASAGGYYLLRLKGYVSFDRRRDFVYLVSFFYGYFSPAGFYMLIKKFYWLDTYLLFMYPVLLAVIGFWISFTVMEAGRAEGYRRTVILLSLVPSTAAAAAVPALYYLNYHSYALMLTVFLPLLCSSVYSILRNDYRRGMGF